MPPRRQLQHNRNQERDRSPSPIVEGDELVTALMTPRRPTRVVVDLREASPPHLREDSPPPRLESEADTAPVFVCSVTDVDGNERPLPSDVVLTIDPVDPHRHRPRAAQHSAGKKRRQPSTVAMDRREGLLGPAEWRSSSPSDGDADPLTEARSESTAATAVAGGDSDDVAHLVHEAAGSDSASDAAAFNDRNDPDDELLVLQLRRRRGRPPAGSRSVSRQECENDPTLAHPVPRATLESETVLRLKARLRLLGLGYQDHKVHLVERLLAHWNGRREGEVAGEQPHAPLHFGAEAGTALDDVEPDVPVELPPRPTFFFRAVRALTSLFESRDEETCDDASEPELELLPGDSDDDAEGAHSDDDEDDCNSDDDGANGRPPLL